MLYDAGEERRWSTDKSEFNRVFMMSNDEQLKRRLPCHGVVRREPDPTHMIDFPVLNF
jgi:hypothetical protein